MYALADHMAVYLQVVAHDDIACLITRQVLLLFDCDTQRQFL